MLPSRFTAPQSPPSNRHVGNGNETEAGKNTTRLGPRRLISSSLARASFRKARATGRSGRAPTRSCGCAWAQGAIGAAMTAVLANITARRCATIDNDILPPGLLWARKNRERDCGECEPWEELGRLPSYSLRP